MAEKTDRENDKQMNIPKPIAPLFGEDLRIDEEDDENLEMLPEIERELILSERFQMLQRYKDEKALYDKYMITDESSPALRKNDHKRGRSSSSSSSYSSSYSDSSYSSSDQGINESKAIRGLATSATVESIAASMVSRLSLDQARKMQLSRDLLMGSFQRVPSDLRAATLLDCFVRIPNGAGEYLICQIVGSVEVPRVSRTSENGSFEVQVLLPNKETVNIPIGSVSNSQLTEGELAAWTSYNEVSLVEHTASLVSKKSHEIKAIKTFVWDDSMVNRMVEEKKKSRATGVKLTLEIAKLRTQLHADLNNSAATSDRTASIQDQISRLEKEYRETQKVFENANAHQFGIVAINHRNRTQQHQQDFAAAKKKDRHTEESHHGLNPFKRRECKPVVMWDVGKRSPRKETSSSEVQAPVAEIHVAQRQTLFDLIDLDQLVTAWESAVRPANRLANVQRAIRAGWSSNPAPIWEGQLLSGKNVGEVMPFEEWKRRVDEDE